MTNLEIKNMALAHLAVDPISDDDEVSHQADVLKRFFAPVVESSLTRTRWKFARTVSTTLAQDPADSDDGYTRWRLPAARLWVQGLRDEVGNELDYRMEGALAVVLSPGEPAAVYCTYLQRIGVGSWPAFFAVPVSYELAVMACLPLTEDGRLLGELKDEASRRWSIAQSGDAQQGGTDALMQEGEATMVSGR